MALALSYREAQFSPSELVGLTGLSLTLQRDWRSAGHIRAREGGRASFSPKEAAEIRLMVKLRNLGVSLAVGSALAKKAAPSVLFEALDCPNGLAVSPDNGRGQRYREALEKQTDGGFRDIIAGTKPLQRWRYAVIRSGELELIHNLGNIPEDDPAEEAGFIGLAPCGRAIAEASPRPLFTLVAPGNDVD